MVSIAFLLDKYVATGGGLFSPYRDEFSLFDYSLLAVGVLLLVCISGLLCAVVGLVLVGTDGARRCAGRCLAVSSVAAVLLFPAVVVLIFEVADSAAATGTG